MAAVHAPRDSRHAQGKTRGRADPLWRETERPSVASLFFLRFAFLNHRLERFPEDVLSQGYLVPAETAG